MACRGVNHGTFLHIAHEEGLIRNTSIHAGIRAPVARPKGDVRNDLRCGFEIVRARDIDRLGVPGVIETLKERVADRRFISAWISTCWTRPSRPVSKAGLVRCARNE